MTPTPSGEASISTRDDSPIVGSQIQVYVPADVPAASGTAVSAEQQDVDQASIKPAASKATLASKDEDKHEDEAAARHRQDPKGATTQLAHPAPKALQTSRSLPNPMWDRPAQDSRMTQSPRTSQSDSLVKEETPQTVSVPDREQDLDSSVPSADVQPPQEVLAVRSADVDSLHGTLATNTIKAVEKPEGPKALNPDTEALPSSESQVVIEWDSVDPSGGLQAQPIPPSPGGSVPPLPDAPTVALGRRPLDSSLYTANEEYTYVRSVTSLLGGGEGSTSSLADVLVWSEATMSMATSILASGHSSMTDLLHSTEPSLHSVSSVLRNAGLAFSSGLVAGTGWAVRSITRMLERMEQRTVEGIRSAVRYLTSHLTSRHSGPKCD